ncbi:MAG TPA: pyrroloquinoline quinone biosynthesis peptide chaperone PqqD [Polyangiaceae bacterium]|nr:pyrroloquinoline quinone biosynthesis peptide chaperone PqqD [Polyangiaceae bacterium]
MIAPSARPKLAQKVKLRLDPKTRKHVLVYPEKGLELNATGGAIASLCTGEFTFEQIVQRLKEQFQQGDTAALEAHVSAFLSALAERGLVEGLEL